MLNLSAARIIGRAATILFLAGAILLFALAPSLFAADPVSYSLCDVRVLYLYDEPATIDWPTLYYLNDEFGCRIDLVTLKNRARQSYQTAEIKNKQIYLHTLHGPQDDTVAVGGLVSHIFTERRPDIVIFDDHRNDAFYGAVKEQILSQPSPPGTMFGLLKVYRRFDVDKDGSSAEGAVVLNSHELLGRYRDRMRLELPSVIPGFDPDEYKVGQLTRYRLLQNNLTGEAYDYNFLSGITPFRLVPLIDSLFQDGPMKRTFKKQAGRAVSYLNASRLSVGKARADLMVDGYRELGYLGQHKRALDEQPAYRDYLGRLLDRAERAALQAAGIAWEGRIILRDTPHGPRVKFRASISADGPKTVTVSGLEFHPYWDTTVIELDTVPWTIAPHQSQVREYLIDIDRSYLEGEIKDSLMFTMMIAYGQIPLYFSSKMPVWEAPRLDVHFEPNYYFVQPVARLDVDRVVSSMNWKAKVTKPKSYSGKVRLNIETPRGMFAGAYRQELELDRGNTTETVRIPFTVSNLFELGVQQATIELLIDGRLVAADTGRIRIAACPVPDTVTIGYLPDSAGVLDDILRLTDATYRPLTDRELVTADLDAYKVILVGSGAYRRYPSFARIKDRLENYLRQGGSLVIFAQPEDWPGGVLPVSFVPTVEAVTEEEITNRIPEARILSQPYNISQKNLLSGFYRKEEVRPAVVGPAERVYVTPSGATLLSVSRLGEGQIVFCGLPVLEMATGLNIEAIHLLANILNY